MFKAFVRLLYQCLGLLLLLALLHERGLAEAANARTFEAAHIFDPTVATNRNYQSWTSSQWITWLHGREPMRAQANNGHGTPLPQKPFNTVLIGTPAQVRGAYNNPSRTPPYVNNNVWSERTFENVAFENKKGVTRVFSCPSLYAASALDGQRSPVHLQTVYDSRPASGNAHYPLRNCKVVW